jgi:hypothetical protein
MFFLAPFADYTIAETPIGDINELMVRAATIRALGIGYVPTIKVKSVPENRVAIATLYSLGGPTVVPWDVYINNGPEQPPGRYYGTVEEYGDLYKFVRKNPALFDDLETAAVIGVVVPLDNFNDTATVKLTQRLSEQQVPFAFVFAGGDASAGINVTRANRFKALVTVNPESDFTSQALKQLRAVSVPVLDAAKVSETTLRSWTPLRATGSNGSVRLYPRASGRGDAKRLVVHVVDESRAGLAAANDRDCRRRVAIGLDYLAGAKIAGAMWHSLDKDLAIPVDVTRADVGFMIPQCTLWGALELEIAGP